MRWLLALLLCGPAAAATIERIPGEKTIIAIEGEFLPTDGERFAEALGTYEDATIVLNSPGGSLVAGMRLGQIVRDRGFTTLVLNDAMCASSCALAWIASQRRSMNPKARIGFHAAYVIRRGKPQESGAGNALVGAYLSRLGLSDDAIYLLARHGPRSLGMLTPRAAAKLGIAVNVVQPDARFAKREPVSAPTKAATANGGPKEPDGPREAADRRSAQFAARYFSTWSDSNERALAAFRSYYAPLVLFYGEKADRKALLLRKQDFAQRWPERVYAVREPSLEAKCEGEERCVVTGLVDWAAHSAKRDAHMAGVARFELVLDVSGARPAILGETGAVVSRGAAAP